MKRNSTLSFFIVFVILFHMLNVTSGVDALVADIPPEERVNMFIIPVVGSEDVDEYIIYEKDGKFCMDIEDIATLSRYKISSSSTNIHFKQGIRDISISRENGRMVDIDKVKTTDLIIYEYDDKLLAEAIPLLNYLGAYCELGDNVLYVEVAPITIWESIMPDYESFWLQEYESDTLKNIQLNLDIIMDVLDFGSGHSFEGLFNKDLHKKDALYEIVGVDISTYPVVEQISTGISEKIKKAYDLVSMTVSDGTKITADAADVLEPLYQMLLDRSIYADKVAKSAAKEAGDMAKVSHLTSNINNEVMGKVTVDTVGTMASIALLGVDMSITAENKMRYDEDSKRVFKNVFDVLEKKDVGYNVDEIKWKSLADDVTKETSDAATAATSVFAEKLVEAVCDYTTKEGIKKLVPYAAKSNCIAFAVEMAGVANSYIYRDDFDGYSADLNAIYIGEFQKDNMKIVDYLMKNAKDKGFSAQSINDLRAGLVLFYRSIISYGENCKEAEEKAFGNRQNIVNFYNGMCEYAALYLYNITNCTLNPIIDMPQDDILDLEWLEMTDLGIPFDESRNNPNNNGMVFDNSYAYYCTDLDEYEPERKNINQIRRINLVTGEDEVVFSSEITGEAAYFPNSFESLNIYDGALYYIAKRYKCKDEIYKLSLSDLLPEKIPVSFKGLKEKLKYDGRVYSPVNLISRIHVSDDYLFYTAVEGYKRKFARTFVYAYNLNDMSDKPILKKETSYLYVDESDDFRYVSSNDKCIYIICGGGAYDSFGDPIYRIKYSDIKNITPEDDLPSLPHHYGCGYGEFQFYGVDGFYTFDTGDNGDEFTFSAYPYEESEKRLSVDMPEITDENKEDFDGEMYFIDNNLIILGYRRITVYKNLDMFTPNVTELNHTIGFSGVHDGKIYYLGYENGVSELFLLDREGTVTRVGAPAISQ